MTDVAISHYCEGAGHATRMLAVGKELDERGYSVSFAGGGPGKVFIELNGYQDFEPCLVDYIQEYQNGSGLGAVRSVAKSVAKSVRRTLDLGKWFIEEDPEVVLTDDMFGALAATVTRKDFIFLTHDTGSMYEDLAEKVGAAGWNSFARLFSEKVIMPALWDVPEYAEKIGPLALDEGAIDQDVENLFVPSDYTPEEKKRKLENRDDFTVVGGENWEIQKSLQPYIRDADAVICTGYSAIMEAAVAGTSCIVIPETSEQKGVCRKIKEDDCWSIDTVESVDEAIHKLDSLERVESHQNGAEEAAEHIEELIQ